MKDDKEANPENWPCSWEDHERDQIIYRLEHSTAEERLRWLEEMLILLGKERIQQRKRDA